MRRDLLTKPKSWAHTSLKEVCYILDYRRVPVNNGERTRRIAGRLSDDLYPYYGATGQVGVIDDFIFEGEHILLGEDGAPFLDPLKDKAYLVQGRFWVNNHAHILKSMISNKYVCHYLNVIDYSEHVTGTTRLKLTQSALRSIPISIPSMAEQRRIVTKIEELFSELDKAIESLKKARAQLATYRQAVLKHAFEGTLTAQWREENKDRLETPEQLLDGIRQQRARRYEQQLRDWQTAVKEWEESGRRGRKPARPSRAGGKRTKTDWRHRSNCSTASGNSGRGATNSNSEIGRLPSRNGRKAVGAAESPQGRAALEKLTMLPLVQSREHFRCLTDGGGPALAILLKYPVASQRTKSGAPSVER